MRISKKKIYAARIIMWGGLLLAIAGIICSYVDSVSTELCIVLLGGGLVITFPGAFWLRRMFRCPHCKANTLTDQSGIDLRMEKVPNACPRCGASVEIVD